MFIEAKDGGGGDWWQLDYWSYKSCKAAAKSSPPRNEHPFCTGRMPFLSPNQQCQSTEGKISHFMELLTPSSPGVFQLCLRPLTAPWGRVAMPLISPLMPVPQFWLYLNQIVIGTGGWTSFSVALFLDVFFFISYKCFVNVCLYVIFSGGR